MQVESSTRRPVSERGRWTPELTSLQPRLSNQTRVDCGLRKSFACEVWEPNIPATEGNAPFGLPGHVDADPSARSVLPLRGGAVSQYTSQGCGGRVVVDCCRILDC